MYQINLRILLLRPEKNYIVILITVKYTVNVPTLESIRGSYEPYNSLVNPIKLQSHLN